MPHPFEPGHWVGAPGSRRPCEECHKRARAAHRHAVEMVRQRGSLTEAQYMSAVERFAHS